MVSQNDEDIEVEDPFAAEAESSGDEQLGSDDAEELAEEDDMSSASEDAS